MRAVRCITTVLALWSCDSRWLNMSWRRRPWHNIRSSTRLPPKAVWCSSRLRTWHHSQEEPTHHPRLATRRHKQPLTLRHQATHQHRTRLSRILRNPKHQAIHVRFNCYLVGLIELLVVQNGFVLFGYSCSTRELLNSTDVVLLACCFAYTSHLSCISYLQVEDIKLVFHTVMDTALRIALGLMVD